LHDIDHLDKPIRDIAEQEQKWLCDYGHQNKVKRVTLVMPTTMRDGKTLGVYVIDVTSGDIEIKGLMSYHTFYEKKA
jgi:hypothetical protein